MTRAALALLLVAALLALATVVHVHAGPEHGHECVACSTARAAAAPPPSVEVACCGEPVGRVAAAVVEAPGRGAPLGAVPGQSPPLA